MPFYLLERQERFINVHQNDSSVQVELFAPAIKPEQLSIWLEHDKLIVQVSGPEEKMLWDNLYLTRTLQVQLPQESWRRILDGNQRAVLHDGVLVVELPKTTDKKVIPVQCLRSSES